MHFRNGRTDSSAGLNSDLDKNPKVQIVKLKKNNTKVQNYENLINDETYFIKRFPVAILSLDT